MNRREGTDGRIAILAAAGRFGGAEDLDGLWRLLAEGVDAVTWYDRSELLAAGWPAELVDDPRYVPAGRGPSGIDTFDADLFGLSAREAEITDPQLRLLLECAREAMEGGGYGPGTPALGEQRVGVFAGTDTSTYLLRRLLPREDLVRSLGHLQLTLFNDKDFAATQIAYRLGLEGPALNLNTACSTSLVTVHAAAKSLLTWECDLALAGGASVAVPAVSGYLYQEGGILSPDGHCRAFDAEAAGTVHGSGAGLVLLKRLEDAIADGDPIAAVLRGSAVNNDGADRAGFTAPGVHGQSAAITEALMMAEVEAETVSYVECHGTGTPLGDPIEIAALRRSFGSEATGRCAIGSVKTNLGHCNAAAGIAGLLKVVLMLQHRQIPPSLHFSRPNPACGLEKSPFYVAASGLSDWEPAVGGPRRAGVSSFGIGGTNAHLVLEEWDDEEPSPNLAGGAELLTVSGRSARSLATTARRLASALSETGADLSAAASTLRTGRQAFEYRGFVVARDGQEGIRGLRDLVDRSPGPATPTTSPPVVLLFPGQGTHYPGMLGGLLRLPTFRRTLEACGLEAGTDFVSALDGRPIDGTEVVQPLLLAVEIALTELWRSWGVAPRALLGHSLGEYTAGVVSGALARGDGLRLVAERGRLMQALPPGSMVEVALGAERLAEVLEAEGGSGKVEVAAINAPEATVIAGDPRAVDPRAVDRVRERLEAEGVAVRRLSGDRAFHSPAVEPMLPAFRQVLEGVSFATPGIPWVANASGTWKTDAAARDPRSWIHQARQPVRFAEGIETCRADLADPVFLEVGPGQVLTGLARQAPGLEPRRVVASGRRRRGADDDLAALLSALGELWQHGVEIDWPAVDREIRGTGRPRRLHLPGTPFERRRYWVERARPVDRLPLDRWFSAPCWRPAPGGRAAKATDQVLVVMDEGGVGEALLQRLGDRGARWEQGEERPSEAATVIDLRLLDGVSDVAEGAERLLRQIVGLGDRKQRLLVAGVGIESVAGEAASAELAFASAICRVAGQERAPQRFDVVDLAAAAGGSDPEVLADRLLTEIDAVEPRPLVAWRGGARWVPGFASLELPDRRPDLAGQTVLITGGHGQIGRVVAEVLGAAGVARMALLGRSKRSEPGVSEPLRQAGFEVLSVRADVGDRRSLEAALVRVREGLGPIHGVIHAAGLTGPTAVRLLAETDLEHLRAHLRPKVEGLRLLAERLDPPPAWGIAVSSLSTWLGGLGLVSYAAANAVLDAEILALRRDGSPTRWSTVDWDGWRFAGERRREELQLDPLEGAAAWRRLLALEHVPRVLVSTGDLDLRQRQWLEPEPAPSGETSVEPPPRTRQGGGSHLSDPAGEGLQQLWRELFGRPDLGLDADFFALGGTSLLAVRLVSLARERLGIELHTEDVLSAPRLGDFVARVVSSERRPDERTWTPITTVSPAGQGAPIFCVHGGGGALLSYAVLSTALGTDQPFYGIRPRGLEPGHRLFARLEEMAAFYLPHLRAVRPRGPYRLLGYCFGGLVALELARELRAQGEEVPFLGLVDTALPRVQTADSGVDHMDEVEKLMTLFGDGLGIDEAELRRRSAEARLEYLVAAARESGAVKEDVPPEQALRYLRLSRNHLELQTRFEPRPYAGSIDYFRATEGGLLRSGGDPSEGWEEIAEGGLRVVDVPGDHWTMVEKPRVEGLAAALRRALETRGS